ncbi:penicillin-binding transpeptidase domain-containing protein [Frankia sp. R82]|uniref:penicillin-binding transpeptidase domain-containing protein n=1 Tax=Frankia sp. R82 TaxID=2950553 RepID=UPI0020433669|nr:penicillin-binding transpeptidase domain-containing protein [Frankia sp. R82]MCM3886615.1 penicillin-binding transpeptidase domain-containing protein [Frankia sp. R82]
MPLTPGGFTASASRRRGRGRRRAIIAAVVVVVLAAASGVGYVLKNRADERAADQRVQTAAAAYLTAWRAVMTTGGAATPGAGGASSTTGAPTASGTSTTSSPTGAAGDGGDRVGRAAVSAATVAGSASVATLLTTMADVRDRLLVTGATFTPGSISRHGATATAPYVAKLDLSGLPSPLEYAGVLNLASTDRGWKVRAELPAVHPALRAGLALDRTASTGHRGELEAADGQPLRQSGDLAGNLVGRTGPLSGLERVYDDRLRAQGGAVVVRAAPTRDAQGAVVPGKVVQNLHTYPMTDGQAVRTTLDLRVQQAAEEALATAARPTAAMVAIDTRTGGVLALANHPATGASRAVRGKYPPGSTFKIVTATAALMNGRTADTPLDCTQSVSVDGRTFQNAEAEQFGTIPLRTAFAKSCNTAFIRLEESLPPGALTKAAALYGFDGTSPLDIASFGGSFPTPRDGAEAASASIGQARIEASPLQMASVAAAVASGTWRQPFVAGQPARSNAIPANVLGPLRDFMRAVVTEGTAATVPMPGEVFGKTGTAEYADGNPPPTHAWFVGYRGDVAFAVVVEDGGFGAETAAPIAARFLTALDGGQVAPSPAVNGR